LTDIVIYTTRTCGYCAHAKALLDSKGLTYKELAVDGDAPLRKQMMALSGRRTVPQIWINEVHIGGCSELYDLQASGRLDKML